MFMTILGGCMQYCSHNLAACTHKAKATSSTIYVQAAMGSFNHQAVSRLYKHEDNQKLEAKVSELEKMLIPPKNN